MTCIGKTIIVNYDISNELTPRAIIRTLGSNSDQLIGLLAGSHLDWKILPEKYCIGYHGLQRDHSYTACPQQTLLDSGTQCKACKTMDTLLPCVICNGSKCMACETVKEFCSSTETSIYLAAFGNDLKIGVSNKDRLMKRWLEQGADYGVEIGIAANSRLARIIEAEISKRFSVPKSMRLQMKMNEILGSHSPLILTKLGKLIGSVSEWLNSCYPECRTENGRITDLRRFYNLSIESTPFAFISLKEFKISGRFLGMKGSLFFFEDNTVYFLDFRRLRGRRISFEETSKRQPKLTDWASS